MESRIVDRVRKVNQDRAGVIEKPYKVTSRDVEGLFDFTQPLRTVEEVIPGGGANGQGLSLIHVRQRYCATKTGGNNTN